MKKNAPNESIFSSTLRYLLFAFILKPFILLIVGLNIRGYANLPKAKNGPCIIVANHNSHLDTLILMSIFSIGELVHVRPVAAADYWLRNRVLAWFSTRIFQIIPIDRKIGKQKGASLPSSVSTTDLLAPVDSALKEKKIVIFYPEGTRGNPERMTHFKKGIAYLAERHPLTPIVPVFIHGAGQSLPRGEAILVPVFCDVVIGEPLAHDTAGDREEFVENVEIAITDLSMQCPSVARARDRDVYF